MLKQKTVVIIGASNNPDKYGNRAVRAYLKGGYTVYPINLNEDTIEGLKVYKSILDVPDEIDLASMYVLPEIGLEVIEEVAKKGVKDVFLNPGAESGELIDKARELGLNPIVACSIVDIGMNPYDL